MHRSVAFWAGCPLGRPHSWGHSSQVSQPIPPGTWSVARTLRYPHISGVSKDPLDRRSRYGAGAIGLLVARHLGTSADFRMNIQKDYELLLTRHKSLKTFKRQARRRSLSGRNAVLTWVSPRSDSATPSFHRHPARRGARDTVRGARGATARRLIRWLSAAAESRS